MPVLFREPCGDCRVSPADDEALVDLAVADPQAAPISPKMRELLALAARVQLSGRAVSPEDVARAKREGATDVEIHDTVLIAAAFCMFNRYVDGLGAVTPADREAYRGRAAKRRSKATG